MPQKAGIRGMCPMCGGHDLVDSDGAWWKKYEKKPEGTTKLVGCKNCGFLSEKTTGNLEMDQFGEY